MITKKVGMSLAVVAFAVSAAFATNSFIPGTGYSSISDFPDQGQPCVQREECLGGPNPCTYLGVPLRPLVANDCPIPVEPLTKQ